MAARVSAAGERYEIRSDTWWANTQWAAWTGSGIARKKCEIEGNSFHDALARFGSKAADHGRQIAAEILRCGEQRDQNFKLSYYPPTHRPSRARPTLFAPH